MKTTLVYTLLLASTVAALHPGEVEPELINTAQAAHRLRPRRMAPQFTATAVMPNEKFEQLSLQSYLGKWTEIVSFSDSVEEFRALNTEFIGVSTDSHHTHLAWIRTAREAGGLGKINFPLVADISKRISADYGVLVEDENDEMYGAAIRGLFLIDPKGKIRSIMMNDDQVGRSVAEIKRLVQAFQYSDSHDGHVCPANWQPGDDTIKADQDDKVEFFSKMKKE
jgi:alkyl hydroperoxide reductase subunit AhpC